MQNNSETHDDLLGMEPLAGLIAAQQRIEVTRERHKAEMAHLQKIAQSYRAKLRWERASKPAPADATGLADVDAMPDRDFNKLLRSMQER